MGETELVALRFPERRSLATALAKAWDRGLAALVLDPDMTVAEQRRALRDFKPSRLVEPAGESALADGVVVPGDVALVVGTSGTSGAPKGAVLTHRALRAAAAASQARLGRSSSDRWLCCLPLSHIGGLMTVVRSLLAGTFPVIHEEFDVEAIRAEASTTLISLVPTALLKLLKAGVDLSHYSAVLLGGAPATDKLLEDARRLGAPVVTTYGMTETAGGCVYDGAPLDGVETALESNEQIIIRGPVLMAGYRLQPELTEKALAGGWFRTADRGEIGPDGRLRIFGRMDDVIITGGLKVSPDKVEAVLLSHPLIADAAVGGVPDDKWGQIVGALVVAKAHRRINAGQVKDFCRDHLARHQIPRQLSEVKSIPRSAAGKILRGRVNAILKSGDADEAPGRGD